VKKEAQALRLRSAQGDEQEQGIKRSN